MFRLRGNIRRFHYANEVECTKQYRKEDQEIEEGK
jgi:hypothetical protein